MNAILYLCFLKAKARLRYIIKKPLIAIILCCYLFMAVGLVLFVINNKEPMSMSYSVYAGLSIMYIGVIALFVFGMLTSSKKALFFADDAYYLLAGPFTRKQVMMSLSFQTIRQSLSIALICAVLFIGLGYGMGLPFDLSLSIILWLATAFVMYIFLAISDYLYILSIANPKIQSIVKWVVRGFVVCFFVNLGILYFQSDYVTSHIVAFVQSPAFFYVPVFGWLKLIMISYFINDSMMVVVGLGLLCITAVATYIPFLYYKGDFYEQALSDSILLSQQFKELKSGKQDVFSDVKIRTSQRNHFRLGAYALMSKNILIMKKTRRYLAPSEIFNIFLYIGISIVLNLGYAFFLYMMSIFIFSTLQTYPLYTDLQNMRIYLIPDKPLRKLIAVTIPTFVKIVSIVGIALIGMGIYEGVGVMTIVISLLNMIGFVCLFISATILSIRLLKSRSSKLFEGFMRTILIIVCMIPTLGIVAYMYFHQVATTNVILVVSYGTTFMNIVISAVIIYCCKDMMNGRELRSE